MTSLTTADVRSYIAKRQAETTIVFKAHEVKRKDGTVRRVPERSRAIEQVSNAEINRELTILKRIFSLAIQAGKLLHKPHIPLLRENNTRTGFFELDQFESVRDHLPEALRPVIEFAYITGWRITSEVLPLQWRQVDFKADEVRLDRSKNNEGRVFPMTDDLRKLLKRRHVEHDRLKKAGQIERWVFWRMVAEGRGGTKKPQPIKRFEKSWRVACVAAGLPGRYVHDLRRSAVRTFTRRGLTEHMAMKLSGHKTPSVFRRYDIISPEDLRDAARKLDAFVPAKKISSR